VISSIPKENAGSKKTNQQANVLMAEFDHRGHREEQMKQFRAGLLPGMFRWSGSGGR
jgi:hypothetical protein